MFIVSGKWKYILVKQSAMKPQELDRLFFKGNGKMVELEIKGDEFYVFDRITNQKLNKKLKDIDVIDFTK